MPDKIVGFILCSIRAKPPRGGDAKLWVCGCISEVNADCQTAEGIGLLQSVFFCGGISKQEVHKENVLCYTP